MKDERKPRIAIVVPCYNEEQVLPLSAPRMLAMLDELDRLGLASGTDSYLLLCDDGSRDGTWRVVESLHLADSRVKGI